MLFLAVFKKSLEPEKQRISMKLLLEIQSLIPLQVENREAGK
jgi:hypothetical protein